MIKWRKLKLWLKYGIIGFAIHTLTTLVILGTNVNCKEMCINPLNLLLVHVILPALFITELLGTQSVFETIIIILSGIVGFIVGAIIGKIKEKSHSK